MPSEYIKKKNKNPDDEFEEMLRKFAAMPDSERPTYPNWKGENLAEWALRHRKLVEGKERDFLLPSWRQIYEDDFAWQMIVGGRQIFKSTYFGDCLGHIATTMKGSTGLYCTYNDESLSAFSVDKYRNGTLDVNQELRTFVLGSTLGQVHRVGYINFAKTYLVTDEAKFHHVEGKSPDLMILDEGQYLDFQHWAKMRESMATTQGDLKIGGIGGEEGSVYHQLWRSTNQMVWKPKYELWREKLRFDKDGLIWGDYLLDVCDGHWEATHPENTRHGYWLPQAIFPHIPLTIREAMENYRMADGEFSIEYKQANYPETDFLNHVMGEFYVGSKRPLTEDMVRACMMPYADMSFLTPMDVYDIKETFGQDVAVFMGVDFGSGNVGSSKTVAAIVLKFRAKPELGIMIPRYFLAYITSSFPHDDDDKAEALAKLANEYHIDMGVGDLGYGEHMVKKIIEGGRSLSTGLPYHGVTARHFKGCWTRQDPVQVLKYDKEERDESGRKASHYTIDKTHAIQSFVDFVKRYVTPMSYRGIYWKPGELHINNNEFKYARSQLIIPYGIQRQAEWLVKEFTSIVRKDIVEDEIREEDKRQRARKEFNHPPDAVMAIIYAMVADEKYDPNPYQIFAVKKRI